MVLRRRIHRRGGRGQRLLQQQLAQRIVRINLFDHGQIHTVAYDPRNGKVYIMLGSRLFAIDAATREVLAHNEQCGTTAVEYDGFWSLEGR